MNQRGCQFDFDGPEKARCAVHVYEVVNLTLETRTKTLQYLIDQGKWAGAPLDLPPIKDKPLKLKPKEEKMETKPDEAKKVELPSLDEKNVQTTEPRQLTYETFDGQKIEMSTRLFASVLCPDANREQSYYMLSWCAHNRVDPFANEAWFAIIQGKPVIQVSKDAWFRRVERHPALEWLDDGIIVETTPERLKDAVLTGNDDYRLPPALEKTLLEWAMSEKKNLPHLSPRLTIKKRGQFVADGETLLGGWSEIKRRDRPKPYVFEVNKEGWEGKKDGQDNTFWRAKAPFMIWKTARKNNCRQAFPELSGLMSQQERDPTEFDAAQVADYEFNQTDMLRKRLFALGAKVPAPVGPLHYKKLHALAVVNFDGRGISELNHMEMHKLLAMIQRAANEDEAILQDIQTDLQEETNGTPTTKDDTGTIQDADIID